NRKTLHRRRPGHRSQTNSLRPAAIGWAWPTMAAIVLPPMIRALRFSSLALILFSTFALAQESEQNRHTDSRARFVHRINLWDEDGRNISMKDTEQRPYSPAMTCARCHPTIFISHGWHFNAPDKSVAPGRGGEPWMYQDATPPTLP